MTLPFEYFSDDGTYYADIDEPLVTQEIFDKGAVIVYMSLGGLIRKLDYRTFRHNVSVGEITINICCSQYLSRKFRYVIIPGGTSVNARMAPVDYNHYAAVKAYYNIPD